MLKTETDTPEMAHEIRKSAQVMLNPPHRRLEVDFEHGQHFMTCLDCGAQWAVCDAQTADGVEYFAFEPVMNDDESCHEGIA